MTPKAALSTLPETVDFGVLQQVHKDLNSWDKEDPGLLILWHRKGETPEEVFADGLHLDSREDYIAFRDRLKAHIRAYAAEQKRYAAAMRQRGGDSGAQWRHGMGAVTITRLIEIRRAGKTWSRARAEAARQAAAA
ncbi:hypothetical protein [Defluviimonas salinarum]|uniref:Uncharacterized protein n=1 Tax=Defluviimonas salinarum TaxID=2992147 RepID=A0ABT3J8B0_9RHOB|nr:hypothetical protein [Defluviimonas salinarum]MCW3783914.1 hypothetical protein [Defluviimonas salinarum]